VLNDLANTPFHVPYLVPLACHLDSAWSSQATVYARGKNASVDGRLFHVLVFSTFASDEDATVAWSPGGCPPQNSHNLESNGIIEHV
jgi:hypothetical protein